MPLASLTRYPGGLTNVDPGDAFADFGMLDPFKYAVVADEFMRYAAAEWTIGGSGVPALLAAGDGGILNIPTIATISSEQDMQWGSPAELPFTPDLTKDLWFAARIRLDGVSRTSFHVGLDIADASPIASDPTNGIYIRKGDNTSIPTAVLRLAGVDAATVAIGTMVDNAWYEFVIAYTAANGVLNAFQNNAAYRLATNPAALPSVALGINLALTNNTAVIRTMGVDYFMAAKQR